MEASTCHTYTFLFSVSTVTAKMEFFGTIFNSFHFLIIAIKNSILDVAGILASYRNGSVNSNGKADGWLMGLYWFQIAWENRCALDEVLTFN